MWEITHEFKTHYERFEGVDPPTNENVRSMQIIFKSSVTDSVPRRPFAYQCRGLCGHDLHRPHLTCLTFCRLRRTWNGKLTNPIPLERIILIHLKYSGTTLPYNLIVQRERKFKATKDRLLRWVLPRCERMPDRRWRKGLLTFCEILAS